jgi:endonuclease/exonuclease/phosphatase family metal-dependent hydrolase
MSKALFILLFSMQASLAVSFSVSTQNLWHYTDEYDLRLDSLNKNLENEKADIMTFQEAWKSFSGKSLYQHYVQDQDLSIHFYKTNNTIVMKEGLSIASKYKHIGKKLAYKLPYSKRFFGKRIMLVSTLKITRDLEVYVINVHFSPFGDRKHERVKQLEFVLDKIQNRFNDKPVFLTGDFNQDEDREFFKPLVDLGFSASAPKRIYGCTFCEENPYTDAPFNSKLDYIFYQKKFFKLENVRRTFVEEPIADHYGIKAEFTSL